MVGNRGEYVARFSTQVAWSIDEMEFIDIGNRDEWIHTGTEGSRAMWGRNNKFPNAKKAEPGRQHYCCDEKCLTFVVRQGAINAWCFAKHKRESRSHTDCDHLREIGRLGPKSNESEKHLAAKNIIAGHLRNAGREKYNVGGSDDEPSVFVEDEIHREGITIVPDIRVTHRDHSWEWGGETFIEIVNTSAPHRSPNQWPFYEGKKSLVVIDVRNNDRGWEFDWEYLPKILVDKLERYFFNRANAPKLWDETNRKNLRHIENQKKKEKEQENITMPLSYQERLRRKKGYVGGRNPKGGIR